MRGSARAIIKVLANIQPAANAKQLLKKAMEKGFVLSPTLDTSKVDKQVSSLKTKFQKAFNELSTNVDVAKIKGVKTDAIKSKMQKIDTLVSKVSTPKYIEAGIEELQVQKRQLKVATAEYNQELKKQAEKEKETADEARKALQVQNEKISLQKQVESATDKENVSLSRLNLKMIDAKKIVKNSAYKDLEDQFKVLQEKAKEIDLMPDSEEKVQAYKDLRKETLALSKNTDVATKTQVSFGKQVTANAKKFLTWLPATQIIMKTIQLINKMIQTVIALDKQLTNIQMVTGYNNEQMTDLTKTYQNMAQQLKVTTSDVTESANEWLRQGLSVEDTNKAITATLKFAKVASIGTAEATKLLTSAMKGYGLTVDSLLIISDKLNKVDMASATSASDLATAMSETATMAKQAGISMDTLIGYLATMQEISQDGAETVGQSMKSILARMTKIAAGVDTDEYGESLNEVETVLNKYDISLRNTDGTMRNVEVVLDQVADKWTKLTNTQQNQIATAIAGTRQAEKFRILMQNYSRAVDLADESLNSLGTTTNKYGFYLESIEAEQNKLTATFEKLSNDVISSGTINDIVSLLSSLLEVIDTLVGTTVLSSFVSLLGNVISFIDVIIQGLGKIVNLFGGSLIGKTINWVSNLFGQWAKGLAGDWGITTQDDIDAVTEKIDSLGESYDRYAELVSQSELSTVQSKELEKLKKDMADTSDVYNQMIASGMDANEAYFRANIRQRAEYAKSIGKDTYLDEDGVEDTLAGLQTFYVKWAKLSMYEKKEGIDSLQAQIDAVEKLGEKYPELKSQIQDIVDTYQDELDAAKEFDPFNYQISKIKEVVEAEQSAWETEKEQLEQKKELEDKILAVQEKQQALAEAERKRVKIYRAGKGFVYESDFSSVSSARKELKEAQDSLEEYKKDNYYKQAIENLENLNEAESELWKDSANGLQDWYNNNAKYFQANADSYEEMLEKIKKATEAAGLSLNNTSLGDILNRTSGIETHHNGGVVGSSNATFTSGSLKNNEVLAKLQKGETVLTAKGVSNLVNGIGNIGNGETINVSNITLPNVSNATQFLNELKSIGRMSLQKVTTHK